MAHNRHLVKRCSLSINWIKEHSMKPKYIFVALLVLFAFSTSYTQSIKVEMKVNALWTDVGMPDAENNMSGPIVAKPDLYYRIIRFDLQRSNGITFNAYGERAYFYENQNSETVQRPNDWPNVTEWIVNNTFNGNLFGNTFDLSNPYSLKFTAELAANEDDLPFQPAPLGDDDFAYRSIWSSIHLLHFASNGNQNFFRTWSIEGTTASGNQIPYPYHFQFSTRYELDALESTLKYYDMSGVERDFFCQGEQVRIRANYKAPFTNGEFEWRKSTNNGASWSIISGATKNEIVQTVSAAPVLYEARLVASYSTYGVSDFSASTCVARTVTPPTVLHQVNNVSYSVVDACQDTGEGIITLTNIPGAISGNAYSVRMYEQSTFNPAIYIEIPGTNRYIENYSASYLSANDISYALIPGNYRIGVFSGTSTQLKCARFRNVSIIDSEPPAFSVTSEDAKCTGGDGQIHFNEITPKSPGRPYYFTLKAISNLGDTITQIVTQQHYTMDLPAGDYTLSAENIDGCRFDYSLVVTIADGPGLSASVAALPEIDINGTLYHGTCYEDQFDADLTINGAYPPFRVELLAAQNNYSRTFQLSENENTITIPNLRVGTSYFIVSDRFGCMTDSIPFTINNPPQLEFANFIATDPTTVCGGISSDGLIYAEAIGGIAPLTLFIDDVPVTEFNLSALGNTIRVLKIIDSQGCEATKSVELFNNTFFWMSDEGTLTTDALPCNGSTTFELYMEGGNASDAFTNFTVKVNGQPCAFPECQQLSHDYGVPYAGYPSNARYRFNIDSPGTTVIEATDDYGCTISSTYQIGQPVQPEVSGVSVMPPACIGGSYEVSCYVKNSNNAPLNYILDGGSAAAVTLNTEDGQVVQPLEFSITVNGDGVHSITLIDDIGCGNPTTFDFDLVTVGTFTTNVTNIKDTNCSYDSTGSINITSTGQPPYQFQIFNADTNERFDSLQVNNTNYTFSNLPSGNYYLQAVDNNGCSHLENGIVIGSGVALQATLFSTSTIDCTGQNGVIEVNNVSGGTAPYAYSLNGQPFKTDNILTNARTNNTVIIKDALGCFLSQELSLPLAGPTLFPTAIELLPASECGFGSGLIELQPGFTFPIEISKIADINNYESLIIFNPGDSIATNVYRDTIENLAAGIHYFLITDGLGCEATTLITISSTAPLSAGVMAKSEETCYQQSADGSITIDIVGGFGPYTITRDGENKIPVIGSTTFTDLSYGRYSFVVEDSRGCFFALEDSIVAGSLPLVNATVSNYQGCAGDNLTGDVSLTGYNGVGSYSYLWADGSTDPIRTNLPTGEYPITVTDGNGCTAIDVAFVMPREPLQLELISITDILCQADANGTVSVSAKGGFTPYEFSTDGTNFQPDSTLNGFTFGDHEIIVRDNHGCLDTIMINIDATNPLAATVTATDIRCNSANNGRLEITPIGGASPFLYSLDGINYQAQNVFENLSPGVYNAWIQDGSGCSAFYDNYIITEPSSPLLVSTTLVTDEACGQMDGSAVANPSGGTPPYAYEWDGDAALNTSTLTNVASGVHTLIVTDANGCTESDQVIINNIGAPVITVQNNQDEICGQTNGSIDLNITDGAPPYTISWSHDAGLTSTTATNLVAGNYMVTVTGDNLCANVISIDVDELTAPVLSTVTASNSICTNDNGVISLQINDGTGPFTYSWSHDLGLNTNAATGLAEGTYAATVTDSNGCTDEISVSIGYDAAPAIQDALVTNSFCASPNGSIMLTTIGGIEPLVYQWSHDPNLNNATANNLSGGSYDVTVTDANGCQTLLSEINVGSVSVPTLSVSTFNNADCLSPMGSITVETTGGVGPFSYAWSHDANVTSVTADDLTSGTYTITVTDANGCQDVVSQSLISFVGSSQVTSTLDCFGDDSGTIAIILEGNINDYQYTWSDASIPAGPVATNLAAGTYSVTVTNVNSCTEVFTEEILEPALLVLDSIEVTPVGCSGNLGSATIAPTGGTMPYSYLWNDANAQTTATATNLSSGVYEVLITDANACTFTATVEIIQSSDIILSETAVTHPLCFGDTTGAINISPSGGTPPYNLTWDDPQGQTTPEITGLSAGTYNLSVIDAVGCTQTYTTEISQPSALEITAIEVEQPKCFDDHNGEINVAISGGTGSYQFLWNGGVFPDSNWIDELSAGVYDLAVSDANACLTSAEIELLNPAPLVITTATIDPVSCNPQPNGRIDIIAEGGDQNLSYQWSNGALSSTIENLSPGDFELSIRDGNGCELITTYEINATDTTYIDLGLPDTTICRGEVLAYDFSNSDYDNFRWAAANGETLSDSPEYTMVEEGNYILLAIRDDGCTIEDTIEVKYTTEFLDAFFIAPTDIVVGDTIVALEVSLPVPDRVEWIYDRDRVALVDSIDNEYQFHFTEEGNYDLTMRAYLGNCSNEITKTIYVYADSTELPFINPNVPTIVDVKVFPNPSSGKFTLDVRLSTELEMVIDLFDAQSILYDRAYFTGSDAYSKAYDLDLPSGVYYVIVQVAGARRSLTLIVE